MNQSKKSLVEHLKGFSVVNANTDVAAAALKENLRRFGPVKQSSFAAFADALDFLLPVKSFTTRYLVLGCREWSILLTDMRDENCCVDAYAISRVTACNALGLFMQYDRREMHLFENGKKVRGIQSLADGDRWYYREEGPLQPFEEAEECLRKKDRDRLSIEALNRYFGFYTGLNVPDWRKDSFGGIFGLERSTKDLRVPLIKFETVQDI